MTESYSLPEWFFFWRFPAVLWSAADLSDSLVLENTWILQSAGITWNADGAEMNVMLIWLLDHNSRCRWDRSQSAINCYVSRSCRRKSHKNCNKWISSKFDSVIIALTLRPDWNWMSGPLSWRCKKIQDGSALSRCSEFIFGEKLRSISLLDFFVSCCCFYVEFLTGVLYRIEQKIAEIRLYCFMIDYTSLRLSQSNLLSFEEIFVGISRWWGAEIDETLFRVLVSLITI